MFNLRHMLKRSLPFVIIAAIGCSSASAQPGVLDPSFSGDGRATLGSLLVKAMVVQPDQRIVVAGYFGDCDDAMVIARLLPNGSLDPSFGVGGRVEHQITPCMSHRVTGMALQPDGRILLSGHTQVSPFVAQFNSDGGIDASFGQNGGVLADHPILFGDERWLVAVQPGGRILLAGTDRTSPLIDEQGDLIVFGITSTGVVDSAFGTDGTFLFDGGVEDVLKGVAVRPDGRIVLAAKTDVVIDVNGNLGPRLLLVGLSANGGLDAVFGTDGSTYALPHPTVGWVDVGNLIIDAQGRLIACGAYDPYNGSGIHLFVMRFTNNGSVDLAYGTDGATGVPVNVWVGFEAGWVASYDDGRAVIGVTKWIADPIDAFDAGIFAFSPDGQVDPWFGSGGQVILDLDTDHDRAIAVALQADGKVLCTSLNSANGDCDVVRLGAQSPVGAPEQGNDEMMRLVFDPTAGLVHLVGVSGTWSARVFDASGRLIMMRSLSAGTGFDLGELSSGAYMIVAQLRDRVVAPMRVVR